MSRFAEILTGSLGVASCFPPVIYSFSKRQGHEVSGSEGTRVLTPLQSNLIRLEAFSRFFRCRSRVASSRACRSSCMRRHSLYCLLVSATAT
jgi:hypothetical protein